MKFARLVCLTLALFLCSPGLLAQAQEKRGAEESNLRGSIPLSPRVTYQRVQPQQRGTIDARINRILSRLSFLADTAPADQQSEIPADQGEMTALPFGLTRMENLNLFRDTMAAEIDSNGDISIICLPPSKLNTVITKKEQAND